MLQEELPWFLTAPDPERIYKEGVSLSLDFETDVADTGSPLNEENYIILACW